MSERAELRDRLRTASTQPNFLLLIAEVLPLELIDQALVAASAIRDPLLRVRTLAALIRRLPSERRQALLDRLRDEARDISHRTLRDAALRSVAAQMAHAEPDFALSVTDAITHDYRRAQARGKVAIEMIHAGNTARATQIVADLPFETVATETHTRAAVVEAARGNQPQAESHLMQARQLADTIHRPWRRAAAHRNLAAAERAISRGAVRLPAGRATGRIAAPAPVRQAIRDVANLPAQDQRTLYAEALRPHMPAQANGGRRPRELTPPASAPPPPPPPAPPPPIRIRRRTRRGVVNTGFATNDSHRTPVDRFWPLATGQPYFFWLNVGEPLAESITLHQTSLPVHGVPTGAVLKVVIFSFADGLQLTRGAQVGELRLEADQTATVLVQPGTHDAPTPYRPTDSVDRLYFPIRTPTVAGSYRLRCSIYHEQVLLQSWLVEADVAESPNARRSKRALRADADFSLVPRLEPATLKRTAQPHVLSLMLNENSPGTIGFRFVGAKDFVADLDLDADELQNYLDQARRGLRKVSWGSEDLWDGHSVAEYRYQPSPSADDARADLALLAIRGYRIYNQLANALKALCGDDAAKDLAALMQAPGDIQIALKRSPRHIFPAGIVYDYPINTNAFGPDVGRFTLCPDFVAARQAAAPLDETPCFKGQCPTRGQMTSICPSGFWGFRHRIGFPVTLGKSGVATAEIPRAAVMDVAVGTSTDRDFVLREQHLKDLQQLRTDVQWQIWQTATTLLANLSRNAPNLVYLYCHGGVANDLPFLMVGDPTDPNEYAITPDNLSAYGVEWRRPQPLVFINGCHTTSLEPETAINFVSQLMISSHAAGVIGTEITVFEPLAVAFAKDCLERFMNNVPLGEAIRASRLALLKAGNPLGLVYVPYALANLHLVPAAN